MTKFRPHSHESAHSLGPQKSIRMCGWGLSDLYETVHASFDFVSLRVYTEMKRGKGLLPVLISKRHPKLTSFEPELYLRSFTH